ncbi:hypothetical protein CHI10_21550 [Bacillus sp. 7894-2]|nr:hypothetical protein CHI10_21550 [Bacillus sp. 7894-2]
MLQVPTQNQKNQVSESEVAPGSDSNQKKLVAESEDTPCLRLKLKRRVPQGASFLIQKNKGGFSHLLENFIGIKV